MVSDDSLGADFMVATQLGPEIENTDYVTLRKVNGALNCVHLPANCMMWVSETYFNLWTLAEWKEAIVASGKTEAEFMALIYRAPGKIGVTVDNRCEYCKAGQPRPADMY